MSIAVIWLDLENAKLISISNERMQRESFHSPPGKKGELTSMFDRLAEHLGSEQKILITGPDQAKIDFISRLKEHHPNLAEHVVGCENSDHPSDQQLETLALRYFGMQAPKKG